jgi:hemerythrin-like metal-binding protein
MVEPFPWSDAFAVGDERLDAEHRRMVGLINRICVEAVEGRRESVGSLLGELQFIAEAHFRNEEAVLTRVASEIAQQHLQTVVRLAIERHAREHRQRLDGLHRLVARPGHLEICDELKVWFIGHVIGEEAQVKTILQSTFHLGETG